MRDMSDEGSNIIIIGMPGCGKSTVGRRLAELTNMPFRDSDTELTAVFGRSPADIILQDGEDVFRQLETAILRELCRGEGQVIATGGGAPVKEENRQLLRQSGTVIYLRRPVELLSQEGRPVSRMIGAEELYRRRRPVYEACADITVDNGRSPGGTDCTDDRAVAEEITELAVHITELLEHYRQQRELK